MSQSTPPGCPFEHIQNQALETKQITEVADLTVQLLNKRYPSPKPVLRGVHPKSHGCVDATFTVNANIDPKYRVGLFANPGQQFRSHIRFSNAAALDGPDIDKDGKHGSRGMAVKVFGVTGDVSTEDNGERNQDFLMINQPVFAFANTEDYLRLTTILVAHNDVPDTFFAPFVGASPAAITRMRASAGIIGQIKSMPVANPMGVRYFSAAPFLFGLDKVMKFSVRPRQVELPVDIATPPGYDYLRHVLTQTMQREGELQFEFMVQVRIGSAADDMGIEDASSLWDEAQFPFVPIATISIHRPQPHIDEAAHKAHCEALSFSPWHCLTAHQPIGSINRLRKAVYEGSSDRRHSNIRPDQGGPHQQR